MRQSKKLHFNFINSLVKSIKDFDYYKSVKNEKMVDTIKYLIYLIIIYSIISTIGSIYVFCNTSNSIKNFINDEINDITYSKGVLSVNNNEYKSALNGKIIIDTSKIGNIDEDNYNFIFFGKEYCNIKIENNKFRIKYNDYFYEDINKEDVLKIISNIGTKNYIIIAVITLFFEIIILLSSTFIDVLIISLIGFIMSKIMKNEELTFSKSFSIAVHSITLPIILAMIYYIINIYSGFYIRYFSLMYTSIAIIYMMTAIILNSTNKDKNINVI